MTDALTVDRIIAANETITAAFMLTIRGEFPGAHQAPDPSGAFSEAKRNLTALAQHLHGDEAWQQVLNA